MTSAHIHAPVRINLIGFASLKPKTRRNPPKATNKLKTAMVEPQPFQPIQVLPPEAIIEQKSNILSLQAEEEMQANAQKSVSSHFVEESSPEMSTTLVEDSEDEDSEDENPAAIPYEDDPVFQSPTEEHIFDPADD